LTTRILVGGSADRKAPHYFVFSTPLLPRHPYAPCSWTPSAYVSPSLTAEFWLCCTDITKINVSQCR
jgi:hypothetical protein